MIWNDFKHDVSKWQIQKDVMNKVCLQAFKSSKNLKSLKLSFKDLSAFKLHPETMKLIESQGKEIEYFELRCLAINSIDMMTSLTKLKSLKLNENFWADDVQIEVISLAKNCPKLDTIEFDDLFFNDETSMLLASDTLFY